MASNRIFQKKKNQLEKEDKGQVEEIKGVF